jgi:hypothetical protein
MQGITAACEVSDVQPFVLHYVRYDDGELLVLCGTTAELDYVPPNDEPFRAVICIDCRRELVALDRQ